MGIDISKAKKILSQSFVDNNAELSEDVINEKIATAAQKIQDLEEEKQNDSQLNAAIQIKKDLESGYNSACNYEKAKIAFLLEKRREMQDQGE